MVRHYVRERMFTAGEVARVNLYPVRRVAAGRGAKRKASRPCQEALNRRNSRKKFEDIAHLNFNRETGGLRVSLDYDFFVEEQGRNPSREEYRAVLAAYVRKLRALYAAAGGELKYMVMTHIGRKKGRIHHHAIISTPPAGVSFAALRGVWVAGYANYDHLHFRNGSISGLTSYFFDNSVDSKWSCSKNCKRPSEEPYEDGSPASVDYIDGHVSMADAKYIDEHPDDYAFIERLFPGYAVQHVLPTAELAPENNGDVYTTMPFGGPFVEIQLYRITAADKPVRVPRARLRQVKSEE